MRRFGFNILSVAAVLLLQNACTTTPQPVDRPAPECFLWKVQSDTSTVYLLGSVHVANDSLYPLHARIMNAFESSDKLVVELNVNKDPLATTLKIIERARYKDGTTLKDHLSQETWDRLQPFIEKYGARSRGLASFKPWYAAMVITTLELDSMGFSPEFGIDNFFLARAGSGKTILELETLDSQLDLFDKSLSGQQEEFLLYSLEELEQVSDVVDEILSAWSKGDTQTMERLVTDNLAQRDNFKTIYKTLITDRNKQMTRKIREYLAGEGTYFIVLGSGHLVGKDGIVATLEKNSDYVVRQQ